MSGLGSELCVAAIGVALFALSPVIRGHVSTFNRIIQCVETGNPYIYIFDGKNHGFSVDFPLNLQETPINLMVKTPWLSGQIFPLHPKPIQNDG